MSLSGVRDGFSLVEVIVAIVILSVGILAMAATTGYISTRLRDAGVATERTMAVQEVVERLRAAPYASVVDRAEASAESVGRYRIWWSVEQSRANLRRVTIVSEGPGYAAGGWSLTARDTTVINIVKPRT